MNNRRHKLMDENGEMVLVNIRDKYTFEPKQATAQVGQPIRFVHDNVFEHTIIYPADGVEKVNLDLCGKFGSASFVVYCTANDIVISRETLYKADGAKDFYLAFPEGSAKVYVSSITGTMKIYKRILRFNKQK